MEFVRKASRALRWAYLGAAARERGERCERAHRDHGWLPWRGSACVGSSASEQLFATLELWVQRTAGAAICWPEGSGQQNGGAYFVHIMSTPMECFSAEAPDSQRVEHGKGSWWNALLVHNMDPAQKDKKPFSCALRCGHTWGAKTANASAS